MKRLAGIAAVLLALAAFGLILLNVRIPMRDIIRLAQPGVRDSVPARPPMPGGPVDINRADAQALDALSGVGPAIAQRIVEERNQNGPFSYPEDLLSVSGIGEKTLERLRDQIHINK